MAHALFTIDVWDTILRRNCHPDEVKLFTARALLLVHGGKLRPEVRDATLLLHARQLAEHELGRESLALGMDDEYSIDAVMERWLSSVLADRARGEGTRLAAWARIVELTQEHAVTSADERIHTVLGGANGSRRIALSDFYMPGSDLAALLKAKAPSVRLDGVVVSCDVGLNKRSGRLYRYIQDRERLTPGQHTHIGDHPEVDVHTAAAMGIHTVHYLPAHHESRRALHRARWARRGDPSTLVHAVRRDIADSVRAPERLTADQQEMFYFGARCAPLYVGLVLRAMEEAISRGVGRVHYFTREGVFFRQVHDALADAAPGASLLGSPLPVSELLEVSRLATFCASLREVTLNELMRIWNLYSTQSIGNLLASLDVPEISVRPLLRIHGIDPVEAIQYPWTDPRVQALFADLRFTATIERARNQKRAVLRRYLGTRGFADDGTTKVIVDIGWRGTIQDNLAHVFPGCPVVGVYLGMHRVLNEQPGNAVKIAYACDAGADEATSGPLLEHVQPLEVLSNSPDGSVRGYTATDASVEAERLDDPGETAMWENASAYFQRGVLAAVPALVKWIRDYAFTAADLRPMAREAVRDIIASPPRPLCRSFFELRHNETFGLGGFVEMKTQDPSELARRAAHDAAAHTALWQAVGNSKWPCAFLRLHGLERERMWLARTRYGHYPLVDTMSTDPNHAAWSITQIEGSKGYQKLSAWKRSWPMRALNRLRYGPEWDAPSTINPVRRLAMLTGTRTFKVLHWLRHTGWARRRALRVERMDALDRW